MGGSSHSGNPTLDAAINLAESVRQGAITTGTAQSAANAAEIIYWRAVIVAQKANGFSSYNAMRALQALGTGGT